MKGRRKWEIRDFEDVNLPFNSIKKLYNYLKINAIDGKLDMIDSDISKISSKLKYAQSTILGDLAQLRKKGFIILLEKNPLTIEKYRMDLNQEQKNTIIDVR